MNFFVNLLRQYLQNTLAGLTTYYYVKLFDMPLARIKVYHTKRSMDVFGIILFEIFIVVYNIYNC